MLTLGANLVQKSCRILDFPQHTKLVCHKGLLGWVSQLPTVILSSAKARRHNLDEAQSSAVCISTGIGVRMMNYVSSKSLATKLVPVFAHPPFPPLNC